MIKQKQAHKFLWGVMLLILFNFLSACSTQEGRKSDMDKEIAAIKAKPTPPVEPIPTFKEIKVERYAASEIRSPFNAPVSEKRVSIGQPDQNRQKEELESFPLDSLKMVGSLHKDRRAWALVVAPNGTIYRVTLGNYLGKNYGKITQIADDGIKLVETVPDGVGGWKKRQVEVGLYGSSGQNNQ